MLYHGSSHSGQSFTRVRQAFLQADGLPFADVLSVVTTLTDADGYSQADLAELFRQRWHAELDLRNIKATLPMDDLRGKNPAMVRREIWVHWLASNLIRKTMAQAALVHEKLPRCLSFAAGLDAVVASWDHASVASLRVLTALASTQLLSTSRSPRKPPRVRSNQEKTAPRRP